MFSLSSGKQLPDEPPPFLREIRGQIPPKPPSGGMALFKIERNPLFKFLGMLSVIYLEMEGKYWKAAS
ncbi:hypothetical protein CsSME_00029635 [Camellia sinensis var. sinensis]